MESSESPFWASFASLYLIPIENGLEMAQTLWQCTSGTYSRHGHGDLVTVAPVGRRDGGGLLL